MSVVESTPRRRHWSDFVAILGGVIAFGFAIWGAPLREANLETGIGIAWLAYAASGALAIAGVILAQRSAPLGRGLVGLGGLVILIGLFAFGGRHAEGWLSILVPGLMMLAAAPFVGPMPATTAGQR